MTAPEFRAALLELPTEREKLLEKGIYGLSERECIVMEREREAAAVEAMLAQLRAAYFAARRGE